MLLNVGHVFNFMYDRVCSNLRTFVYASTI